MAEAIGLPIREQVGGALHYLGIQRGVGLGLLLRAGEVVFKGVVGELFEQVELLAVIEQLEVAKTQMTGRHAQQARAALQLLALYRRVGADHAQRAGGGNA